MRCLVCLAIFKFLTICSKGIAASAIPYKRTPPSWLKVTPEQVNEHVCKLAKKGLTPSQIGVLLRDSHGIGQVRNVTGAKILRILKANGPSRIASLIPVSIHGQFSSTVFVANVRPFLLPFPFVQFPLHVCFVQFSF